MNCKLAFLALVVGYLFNNGFTNPSNGQEPERDPGQASVLLRGIVQDGQGKPIVGATVVILRYDGKVTVGTKSIEKGAFALRVPTDSYRGSSILIQDESKQMASLISAFSYDMAASKNVFRAVLKPLRETTVTVVDVDGKSLADASVRLYADYTCIVNSQSDAIGQVQLKFPADAKINWVIAFKSGHGFEYYENYESLPSPSSIRLDVPAELKLKLDGFTTVKVKVVDTMNQPIAGVAVTPWMIGRAGKVSYVNLSGDQLGITDANGMAIFDWIPIDLNRTVTFLIHDDRYHCPSPPDFVAGTSNSDLETTVLKLCTVRGKVRNEDGTPAAGIRLQGEGRGATNHYYRGHTSTKSDGTFEMQIYPDQDTIIAITDERFAAKSAEDIKLKEGKSLENVNFDLSRGFAVSGLFTQGEKNAPVAKQTATLIQKGPNGSQLVRWSETDKNGRYQFRVGPGRYELRLLHEKTTSITVAGEDLIFDSHVNRLPRGMFSGKVVDKEGKPLMAEIYGESTGAPGHRGLRCKTKEDGEFMTERWNDPMILFAFDALNRLAVLKRIEADTETVTLQLEPAASLRGSVKDEKGNPLKNVAIMAWSNACPQIRLSYRADTDGNFSIPAVTAKMTWNVTTSTGADSQSKDIDVQEAKDYQLEAFIIPSK